jgi:hypothetical protein
MNALSVVSKPSARSDVKWWHDMELGSFAMAQVRIGLHVDANSPSHAGEGLTTMLCSFYDGRSARRTVAN